MAPRPDLASSMLEPLGKKILASRVYDIAVETPLQDAPTSRRGWTTGSP